MSWLPSNDPVLGDPKILRRARSRHRAAHPRSRRRIRGAARAAAWQAADGRALHLLRPFRAGAVHRRQGHGRAPASAYRARHRHLSVRRPHHAPRQRGQHPGDPARRHEPDDGRPRHRAFRAHAATCSAATARRCSACRAGSRCRRASEEIAPSFQHYAAEACRPCRTSGFTARVIAGTAFGVKSPVEHGVAVVLRRSDARRPAPACRSIPTMRSARSIWSTARSRSRASATRGRAC